MACKGICIRHKAQKPVGTGRYAAGQKRCQVCEIFPAFERFFKFVDYEGYELGRLEQEQRKVERSQTMSP